MSPASPAAAAVVALCLRGDGLHGLAEDALGLLSLVLPGLGEQEVEEHSHVHLAPLRVVGRLHCGDHHRAQDPRRDSLKSGIFSQYGMMIGEQLGEC